MATTKVYRLSPLQAVVLLGGFAAVLMATSSIAADLPAPTPAPSPLALDAAIRLALQQNPEIAALRQQHGIAAAGVVIALELIRLIRFSRVGCVRRSRRRRWTNNTPFETTMLLELELRGQGKFRKAAAQAVLMCADREIAAQETTLSVRVIRAFDSVVYRFQKNQLPRHPRTRPQNSRASEGACRGRQVAAGGCDYSPQ